MNLNLIVFFNFLTEVSWLATFCYMIYLKHFNWAAICLFGAFFSGYNIKQRG